MRRPNAGLGSRPQAGHIPDPDEDEQGLFPNQSTIYDREDEYKRRRLNRIISPERNDAFTTGDQTPDARVRTYADIMKEAQLRRELDNTMVNITDKKKREVEEAAARGAALPAPAAPAAPAAAAPSGEKRRNRWDQPE